MFAGTSFLLEHADGTLMVGANHILKGVNLDLESKGIEVGLRSKTKNLAIPFFKRVSINNQGDCDLQLPAGKQSRPRRCGGAVCEGFAQRG